mmetsp:Transcript_4876/g.5992  ORF Transcript_4876/g.5992 Transcript_4876/m.5992 type:complete len:155 (+) Transcript_4876:106-570(+)|eukprot:CAMPEP_0184040360 /NCGR_PEP_ID=MMETSP0955-20130417/57507_1 /TAXON_ID=627963 /ORGANISM="Aplanochytrium sp, Strain PBS07" /LENGTH=154 /DNA_ID=CAMNT_0026330109 /DNA_START=33 /DNA_END=497 /DNA_ORIENTATION=+
MAFGAQKTFLLLCSILLAQTQARIAGRFLRTGPPEDLFSLERQLSQTYNRDTICVKNKVADCDIQVKIKNTRTDVNSGWLPNNHYIGQDNTWCYNLTENFSNLKAGDDFHTEIRVWQQIKNYDTDCHPHINYLAGGGKHEYKATGSIDDRQCSS